MENFTVQYSFMIHEDEQEVFQYEINGQTLELLNPPPAALPSWTEIGFQQCSICPLTPATHTHCPLAVRLVEIVNRFQRLVSHEKLFVRIVTDERIVSQDTTAQRAISSLVGLLMATSGCPHLAYFKPMARFHLPLSSEEETIYRVTSMYMLAQYFLTHAGRNTDPDLSGLKRIYDNIHVINNSIANRLRAAVDTDSSINALILLDLYTTTLPIVIEDSLDEMEYLFQSYIDKTP